MRVDQALESDQVVSTSYDPMLGKVIAHGPDRETARLALVAALDDTAILGLTTNAGFLRALVASDEFRDATIDTAWLDHHDVPAPDADVPRVMAAWVSAMLAASDTGHPFQADGFRLGAAAGTDRGRARPRGRGRPRRRHRGRRTGAAAVAPRTTCSSWRSTAAPGPGRRQRPARHRRGQSYHGQRHVLTGPDRLADHADRRRRHASSPRCPAPCSRSGSPRATGSRRARCSA